MNHMHNQVDILPSPAFVMDPVCQELSKTVSEQQLWCIKLHQDCSVYTPNFRGQIKLFIFLSFLWLSLAVSISRPACSNRRLSSECATGQQMLHQQMDVKVDLPEPQAGGGGWNHSHKLKQYTVRTTDFKFSFTESVQRKNILIFNI